ncbi:MAG: nucleotide sugar dehydratase [Rhodospirillales bacterium RIFCSPLOWO2_12_FULL_58_28]|nr:MAG: nucleotide sugar dehydratase [Rhodospirillales bacterium RIFCSPLOWO2_02_FULL_58_16]OHC79352.1 MAG: nucleotide sugar dehydratase [Rhodospirillales bacterium RIFCSPLOWO2_12_FULL_58_28]
MITKLPLRGYIVFVHDIIMAALAFYLSLYLRLGGALYYYSPELLVRGTLSFTVIAGVIFLFMGLYRGVWRYASLNDLLAIARAATLAVLVFMLVMFLWTRLEELPRSLPFITWFVLMALLGGPRFLYRLFKDRRYEFRLEREGRRSIPVLLAGADDGAELFIRSLSRSGENNYQVVGIVADNSDRVGRHIHGVKVLGTTDEMHAVVRQLARFGNRPQRLILTRDNMDKTQVRRLLDSAAELGMTLARLPKLTDFKSGVSDNVEVRPVALEDLLGRPQTALDRDAMNALIKGRRVLVTGAGGSIGSELVRQICGFSPSALVLLDNCEFNLYAVDLETSEHHGDLPRKAVLADVRNQSRIEQVFAENKPDLVFHAAALKHVPMVEANIFEGITTNVIGSVNIADACIKNKTAAMVLISTDKAVNPTSIMGAAKRIAEQYCQTLDIGRKAPGHTCFVTVRFGNVLGSTGSVVPLFQSQLAKGGPLTVTHPEMKRYFMTVREAVELVLQASAIGVRNPAHEGKIFVLDMGEPVRILDLANQMIRLAGLEPDVDIKIDLIGLRPGEKLFEEMLHAGESPAPTEYPGILLAAPRSGDALELKQEINRLAEACSPGDSAGLMEIIRRLVPEYHVPGDAPLKN